MELRDALGRVHDDLRISVTDRCNLRCAYCLPVDPDWLPRPEILSYEEIARVVRVAARAGVRKVRLTGGEPLARRGLTGLVREIAAIPGIADVALTTNGTLLAPIAGELAEAGLRRVNVSLDTIDPVRFERMLGRGLLSAVLEGIDAALAAGLHPVRVNVVLVRGVNDDETVRLAGWGREKGVEVRFIELMPLGNGAGWDLSRVVTGAATKALVDSAWPLVRDAAADPRATSRRYLYADGAGAVGFVNTVSEPFCSACRRLRLTADGTIRACLRGEEETDLKAPMREGADDETLAALILDTLRRKRPSGGAWVTGMGVPASQSRTMHRIGG